MKFGFKNLGPIKDAEIELGDLTILCGPNNVGKSYLTYSIYSFLETIPSNIVFEIKKELIKELISTGSCVIDFEDLWSDFSSKLGKVLPAYSRCIPRFLAFKNKNGEKQQIQFTVSEYTSWKESFFEVAFDNQDEPIIIGKDFRIFAFKEKNEYKVNCSLKSKTEAFPSEDKIGNEFRRSISSYFIKKMLPLVFGLTGERSGIAFFGDFLNKIARESDENEKYKEESNNHSKRELRIAFEYALPLRDEVNFLLNLKHYEKEKSGLKDCAKILKRFADIAGGQYLCNDDCTIQFVDEASGKTFLITETSSSIKSLAELFFYVKHIACPGQMLMIDEPELNLHPANQRKIARFLAILVKSGVRVFVTTHSDYIIRELNTLIMLNSNDERTRKIRKKYGYSSRELLDCKKVRCYVVDHKSIEKMDVSQKYGIEVTSFDDTIDQVNKVQQTILYGAE